MEINSAISILNRLNNQLQNLKFFISNSIKNPLLTALIEPGICLMFSAVTSLIALYSYQLFRKYKHRIIKQKRIISNQFKLHRQLVVMWNRFTKKMNLNLSNEVLYANFSENLNAINHLMIWYNYEKNRKMYEMNNLNTFCLMKFNMQVQGKSHLIIKNSGMMIGAFHKLASAVLLR
jgi:hypothetical protein